MTARPRFLRRRHVIAAAALLGSLWIVDAAGPALVVTAGVPEPDAIVMLASHEWERLPAAAALARTHARAQVILTVPESPTYWNCFRCPERVDWLEREGIDRRRIVELSGSRNTYTEARVVAAHAAAEGLRRILVVTSPYHTRRALAAFRAAFGATAVEVGVSPASSAATPDWWWLHDVDRAYVAYEWAALASYAVRHRMSPF